MTFATRTIPRPLALFREIVNSRGTALRNLTYDEIQTLEDSSNEELVVDGRPATIATIVQRISDGSVRVVLQGFMNARLFPLLKHVALDGFYKYRDGAVKTMADDEFYDLD